MGIRKTEPACDRRGLFPSRTRVGVAIAGALLLGFSIWVFAEMLDDVPKGEFRSWDDLLLKQIRGGHELPQGTSYPVVLAKFITAFGGELVLGTVSIGALVWLAWRRRWRAALVFAVAAIGAPVLTNILKHHYARARPDAAFHLVNEHSWSFPSGHALASSAIYFTLSIVFSYGMSGLGKQVGVVAGGFLLSFLIGLTRIYLGVHYPTDVIAGWSAGIAWSLSCSAALIMWEHSSECRPDGVRRANHTSSRW